jgi:hypothetical protein
MVRQAADAAGQGWTHYLEELIAMVREGSL